MFIKQTGLLLILLCIIAFKSPAQHEPRNDDILFRTHIVREVNLNDSFNQQYFGRNFDLSAVLLDAAITGKVTAYENENFEDTVSAEAVLDRLEVYYPEDSVAVSLGPEVVSLFELGEEVIFDKHRSEIQFNGRFITLFIPEGESTYGGMRLPVATFRYDDAMEVLRNDSRAETVNPVLNGRKINFADVFVMKGFRSHLVKAGHADELYFDQIFDDPADAWLAGKDAEYKLINYLYRLYHP